ncbi:thiamine pyrophosphate-dependent enzyme [Streptomyces sp. NBC_00258]|uniref:thiamine pyrophosphate-dependent enzyme n=1 Tax=Streptomyces sp. NBC_00258 TaxID=2903642 RepID=UPI002E2E8260|nr:thiamine pyrophosphate-binding protein [Streptomyces sp. NBC_00258]
MTDKQHQSDGATRWHKLDELPDEGRVHTAVVDGRALALSRCAGKLGALDNHCPHQGGPLGEGSIENGWLRCPWHGYDYNPTDGRPPEGFSDAPASYEVEERADGAYVALPAESERPRSVSDVLVETLVAWGVDTVFGMVGHSNLGFAEAVRRAEERGELRYIGIRHEGAGSFAASAYGKLTGRPAVCLGIAGPGSTNMLTGLYDARLDSAPVLAVSGQVPSTVLGCGAFQDVDLSAVFRDVALSTVTVHAGSDHAELAGTAVKHALDGRGVAHLVLPDEVQDQPSDAKAGSPAGRQANLAVTPPAAELTAALERLRTARRPVLIVGEGARGAQAEVTALGERLGAPVLTTFRAKGLVADTHPLGAGVLGRSGTPVASWLMNESDLLLVVGASFANHTGIAPYKPIIQVDDTPAVIGRFTGVDVGLLGDAAVTLTELLEGLGHDVKAEDQRDDVAARWAIWRKEKERRAADDRGQGLSSAAVFAALTRHCPTDAVMTVDVGNHAYSFGRYFESTGQPVLMSGYLGSIGFGYPAAMGAWAADPSRPIVAVTGDGGFGQYLAELTTAVKHHMPIKHVLLDNGSLGKISKEQLAGHLPVWQTSLVNPDFADFARSCGATGLTAGTPTELDDAMRTLFATDGPALLHLRTDATLV